MSETASPGKLAKEWMFHLEHAKLLHSRGATSAALLHLEQISGRPGVSAAFLNGFGLFLQQLGEHGRAVSVFQRAVALAPDEATFPFNLGLSLLARGQLSEGWKFYEAGRRLRADPLRRYPMPEWKGESITGKTLYLWEEQGIGDTLLFGTMVRDLQSRGARCILECDPRLVPLFRRANSELRVVPSGPFADLGPSNNGPDYHAPIGSIGRFVRPTLAKFPEPAPIVRPAPARVTEFAAALGRISANPKVGLSWRSASNTYRDKSIPIRTWGPVLGIPNLDFVALQYGEIREDLHEMNERFGARLIEVPGLDRFRDIDGLAALISACDLVVTISNVTANIAGALGKPTILLVGPSTLWYWFQDREDSPWYANMRLVRARRPNDWGEAVHQAAAILQQAFNVP